ncbi:Protein CBG10328 [Caenorhabditis briggsae]|uniref:Tyrosine-protein kinase n=1 Tax=Caenorhabditis briggsae TaxID=6238 RepID=A8XAK9_CAEBR|nr:Protein CBG10328 [Caenorhabditis briggsae]CAP29674.1 Protein CBG10328 [Caenorhabditis briggsae]
MVLSGPVRRYFDFGIERQTAKGFLYHRIALPALVLGYNIALPINNAIGMAGFETSEMLHKPGDFLVRTSEPIKGQPRQFILSAIGSGQSSLNHFVIRESENKKVFVDQRGFSTIIELVNHYVSQKDPIFTKDQKVKVVLKNAVERQKWELQHEDVQLTKKLGEGAFGEVWKGKLLKHINVVKFYGVAAGTEPLYVIMELADGGALDSALSKQNFPMIKKYEMIYQAACGLAYIHEKELMHRDVAARNCLYGGGQVKIADFGLTRPGILYKMDLTKKVPIRWLPPETIQHGLYTPQTDVFAFGIMAWEIIENGKEPYPGMKVLEVALKVCQGYRMNFNKDVDRDFEHYIKDNCWPESWEKRPIMKDVVKFMKEFVKKQGGDTGPEPQGVMKKIGNKLKKNSKEKRSSMSPTTTATARL